MLNATLEAEERAITEEEEKRADEISGAFKRIINAEKECVVR